MNRPRRVGLPWYNADDYDALRACLVDGTRLPERYEVWRISAEQIEGEVQRSGVEVVRVPIAPDAFLAWCARTGLASDGSARARYAAEAVMDRCQETSSGDGS